MMFLGAKLVQGVTGLSLVLGGGAPRSRGDAGVIGSKAATLHGRLRRAFRLLGPALLIQQVCLAVLPAEAANTRSFDLFLQSFSPPNPDITGTITLDFDAIPAPILYDDPTKLPDWVVDMVFNVPGPGPYGGQFHRSDFAGLIWDSRTATTVINFDFNNNLIGQQGWGTTCPFDPPGNGTCSFRLIAANPNAPTFDAPFQVYTRQAGAYYLGLKGFVPASNNPTAPAPAPLPLAGAAIAVGWSRRLRNRRARRL